jgi:hypothetical protein
VTVDPDAELLAEAARIVNEAGELEVLEHLVRMHAAVAQLLDALERRINEVAGGAAI